MSRWTPKQVADAAPDAASLTAARRLARPGPWTQTGSNDTLLWGMCQGSGSTPYQVSVDQVRPTYRCSCPSRKLPCKHALALLLLWSKSDGAIADVAEAAGFASEWSDTARAAAEQKAIRADRQPDPAAQAKRLEARIARMTQGIDDFELWLADLVRAGLAAARHQPYSWWDTTAARLVDAQLPGLADQVRVMGSDVHAREDWADHLLEVVGQWWTATRAWLSRGDLDPATMADLRVCLGWSWATDDVRASGATSGAWLVLGAHRTDDGRLQQQRTWMWSQDQDEIVQLLDFAVRGNALPVAQLAGARIATDVAYYPGHTPRRALLTGTPQAVGQAAELPQGLTVDEALTRHATALADNPWLRRTPVVLAAASLTTSLVIDQDGAALPLTGDSDPWRALALTGSHPGPVFGELEGHAFRPLTVSLPNGLVAL